MNKQELKKILKPLIKECIKEVIFEDGTLSSIIAEVMKGVGTEPLVEQKKTQTQPPQKRTQNNKRLQEQRKKMLDAIGKAKLKNITVGAPDTIPIQCKGIEQTVGSKGHTVDSKRAA